MKKTIIAIATILVSLSLSAGEEQLRKLMMAQKIIDNFYVDSINEEKVVEEAIIAMLKTLDPHSVYTNKEETKEMTTPLQGNFSGIGIQFQMVSDTLYVIQTTAGGPSEKVGILAGDKIISAGDSIISGVKRPTSSVMKILRGPKGTEVDVTVVRKGEDSPIVFRITRDDIPQYSVDAVYMINKTTGYIRVTRFAETTDKEFHNALSKLKKRGMQDLIVDLEDNGGGYLGAAVALGGEFLDKESVVVSVKSERGGDHAEYKAEGNGLFRKGKLVIMVNQYSASASEILSGAIQDYDRGVIVGRRTFGKGLVQRPFPFPDGSMIRLTVARYYTPSGRLIQKPYSLGDKDSYNEDMLHRYEAGEFMSADSIHFDESLKTRTLNKGRIVYGGGGIMPDVFVPVDTTSYSRYYRELVAKGVINKFVIGYVDNNRKQLQAKYKKADDFIAGFEVDDEFLLGLVDLGQQEGVEYVDSQFVRSKENIRTIVKGLIGRDLFESYVYSQIVNPLDPIFVRALEIISDDREYYRILSVQSEEVND